MGQSIPTNLVGRVAAPASTGPRAVETPQKLALDAAVANELARQAEQGYTQGEMDARSMPEETGARSKAAVAWTESNKKDRRTQGSSRSRIFRTPTEIDS